MKHNQTHKTTISAVKALACSGRQIVSGSYDGTILRWDLGAGLEPIGAPLMLNAVVNCVTCTDDKIFSGHPDGNIIESHAANPPQHKLNLLEW